MGHVADGSGGSWVSSLMGQVGHVTWVMGQFTGGSGESCEFSGGSDGSCVSSLVGQVGHGSVHWWVV